MRQATKNIRRWNLVIIFIGISLSALSQNKIQQKIPEKTRILFVLDGSGSMNATWDHQESRMDIAKKILTRLVDSLRVNTNIELALRVYGHRFSRQANNCQDSKLEVPFSVKNHNTIINTIRDIKPKGVTPITYSILQAAKDFPSTAGYRNILILITDGIESCGADPCAASLELQRKGIFLRPFIIGLGIQSGKVLDCVGKFIDSGSESEFYQVLNQAIETTFAKTTVTIELLDGEGRPRETNINVSFVNASTGAPAYEFIHYRDKQGKPDTVQIDPVLSYDITVNTLPPVVRKNVSIINGEHNTISIAVAQGSLVVKSDGRGNAFNIIVRQKGKTTLLNQQRSGDMWRYLEGDYEIETLTLPRKIFQVKIDAEQTKTITLAAPGLVNLNTLMPGYGGIFEILETGETQWVCNLSEADSNHSYNLLPGSYKVVFRARQAGGSKYTATKNFEIKSGQTVNLKMF
jgi:Ca-activated chloride channel homolog